MLLKQTQKFNLIFPPPLLPAVLVIHLDCSGVSCPILEISAAEVLPSLQCN